MLRSTTLQDVTTIIRTETDQMIGLTYCRDEFHYDRYVQLALIFKKTL